MSTKVKVIHRDGRGFVLRWRDPVTEKMKEKRATQQSLRKAHREAQQMEDELVNRRKYPEFDTTYERYVKERMRSKSRDYRYQLEAGAKRIRQVASDRGIKTLTMRHIDEDFLSQVFDLLTDQVSVATAKSYRGSIASFLNWAVGIKHCDPINWRVISIDGEVTARGRALTGEEVDRMIETVASIVGAERAEPFENLIRAMHLSGMRLGEALDLNEHRLDCHHVTTLDGKPAICFLPHQKNKRSQTVTMTREFEEFLNSVEPDEDGYYFTPKTRLGSDYVEAGKVGRVISKIGEKARIVVRPAIGDEPARTATAHDLRRSFATRWALKVKPFVLQYMMRHSDIKTTLQYYASDMGSMMGEQVYGSERQDGGRELCKRS